MILQPARDYNRRFDRHNPYLPKSVGKKQRAKGEPKSDLDGKKKRENPAVLPCPKDPRAVGFRFAPGGCCFFAAHCGHETNDPPTPKQPKLVQSQRGRGNIQGNSCLLAGLNAYATNLSISLAVANDLGLQGVVKFFAGFESRRGKQPGR